MKNRLFIFLLITLLACNENISKQSTNVKSQKITSINEMPTTIDTLKIDSDQTLQGDSLDKIYDGAICYFSLNGIPFRMWMPKIDEKIQGDSVIIENKINDKWTLNVGSDWGNRGVSIEDVNLDGYRDLSLYYKLGAFVLLFSPKEKRLKDKNIWMAPSNYFLDSSKKIFYYIEYAQNANSTSVLSKFQEDSIYRFYQLESIASEDDLYKAKEFRLYKCQDGYEYNNISDQDELLFNSYIKKFKPSKEFNGPENDPIPYWRKNYKQLIKDYN